MPAAHSRASTALLTYATNVGAAVLSLVNVLIVARSLGPSGRGDIAFLIAVVTLSGNSAAFGVQEANANLGGQDASLRPALATNSVVLALALGLVAAAVVAALSAAVPSVGGEVDRVWLLVALAAIPLVILKVYLQFLLQSEYAFGATNLAWIVGPTTTAVTNTSLALAGTLSVGSAIIAWIVGQGFGVVIMGVSVHRRAGFGSPRPDLARTALGFGVKVHFGRLMTLGNYRLDQWFLGAISGSRQLGLYSVAVAWAEVLYYVPGVLVLVQRPDVVRASSERAARLAAQYFRIALLVAAVVALALVVLAPVLCAGVFGEEFAPAVGLLRILALAAFGIVSLELLGSAVVAQRRPLATARAVAVAFVTTIGLDLVMIPVHGATGAAIATTAAWTVGGLAMVVVFRRVFTVERGDLVPRVSDATWALDRARSLRKKVASPSSER